MKIVIEIDKETLQDLYDSRYVSPHIKEALRSGTPLPKGHGALKDVDKIISDGISKGLCDWYDEIKYADTIIEADKAEMQ